MTPADIYAMPTVRETPWHEDHSSLPRFLGDEEAEFASRDGVEEETPLRVHRKLTRAIDHERSVSYDAYLWEGRPVALLVISGRGGNEDSARMITDLPGYLEAKAYVRRQLDLDSEIRADVVGADAEIEGLDRAYGHVVMDDGDGPRLVSREHLDADGNVMFDQDAFRAHLDAIVRPAFGTGGRNGAFKDDLELGIKGTRMRELAALAVAEAVAHGADRTVDFDPPPPDASGQVDRLTWTAALARNAEGTYGIGLGFGHGGSHFTWANGMIVRRLGGPGLYDELARDAVPAHAPR